MTVWRALLLAAAAVCAAPAHASLPGLDELATARPELATTLQTELPRELPRPCEGEQCGEPEVPQPKTRVRGFELDLYCRLGGDDGLSCRPRRVWLEEYGEGTSDRLVYAKARYFDPQLGRFLSQDSYLGELTEPPSLHRYLYANDNPTFYTDPTGHYSWNELKDDARNLAYLGLAYNATMAENMFGGPQASLAAAAEVRDSLASFSRGVGSQGVDLVKGGVGLAVQDQVLKQRLSQGLADLALTGKGTGLKQLADDTVGMGLGAVREAQLGLGLLGHGLLNPGEVLDVAATLGPNATSRVVGRATFDTGLFVAPMARGGQAATVGEAAGGFANITPEAQALAEFALGVPEGAYGVGNALPKAIPALAAPATAPVTGDAWAAHFRATYGSSAVEWTSVQTDAYGDLATAQRGTGVQANHLNQNAAYGSIIPRDQGVSVGMRGNAFTERGSEHFLFHESLERFWEPFRRGGARFGQVPSNGDYIAAMESALREAGHSPGKAAELAQRAANQQLGAGLNPAAPVPRIPGRLPQIN